MAEPWRNGVVERFNDWWRQKGLLTRLVLPDHAALRAASWDFEARHNAHARYSKLNGRTPDQALHATARAIQFPETLQAPQHPMVRPVAGHIHVVRLIRDNAIFDLFGEPFRLPPTTSHTYVHATIDVAAQQLTFQQEHDIIDQRPYQLR